MRRPIGEFSIAALAIRNSDTFTAVDVAYCAGGIHLCLPIPNSKRKPIRGSIGGSFRFLFICYILAYLDRVNVGFAKLQMSKDLWLSDAAFATGAGLFFIGYFFFEVPSNVLLTKFGARIWIARIMVTWGVISAAMMFLTGDTSFYAMRFVLGLAEAGFFPGIIFYLTLWYPSQHARAGQLCSSQPSHWPG